MSLLSRGDNVTKELKVKEVIGVKIADSDTKGDCVYRKILELSKTASEIVVSFEGVELVNLAFLNNAIGKLFNKKEFDLIKCPIKVTHLSANVKTLLKESVKVARLNFSV